MEAQPTPLPPFACTFNPYLTELMLELQCSIAITTYQAGKVLFISPTDQGRFSMLPRSFDKPMGMAIEGDRLVLATRDEVLVFENSRELAEYYPHKPGIYDSLFLPRVTLHTGRVDLHDVAFGNQGIYAINTSFSCLCHLTGNHNFLPIWAPPFITELAAQDRCHLNGLLMLDGKPKYVTALGNTNTPQGWRDNIIKGGLLMDIEHNEVVLEGLAMPHTPIWYKGSLLLLLSATGELINVDIKSKTYKVIKQLDGFCRGMDVCGDYLFVGMSRLRKHSSTFSQLSFAEGADFAGIKVIHLPTGALVGELQFQNSVDEIYAVQVLPKMIKPNILNTTTPLHRYALSMPGTTFWADPGEGE